MIKKIAILTIILILLTGSINFGAVAWSQVKSVQPTGSAQSIWIKITQDFHLAHAPSNPDVARWIRWYTSKSHRWVISMMLQRATPYVYFIDQQLQKRHMPLEFILLPMVESGYDPFAYSQAGASGLWQMVPATATSYGLGINWWYDQRCNIVLSTDAALTYLQRLYHHYGHWLLAAAAYNTGQGHVDAAIANNQQQGKATDFWSLALSQQTQNYVPKWLALAYVLAHAERYDITLPFVPDVPYFKPVRIQAQLDLGTIATLAGVSAESIRALNPGLRRYATEPHQAYQLLLPVDSIAMFKRHLQQREGDRHLSWQYHQVHQGESLAQIADAYHTTASTLKRVNQLDSTALREGQGLLVPLRLHKKYHGLLLIDTRANNAKTGSAVVSKPKSMPVSVQDILEQYGLQPKLATIKSDKAVKLTRVPQRRLQNLINRLYPESENGS